MPYTVGSVPYVNARPLVWRFEQPGSQVRVVYDVPSRLPALLDSGAADAVLASSFDAITTPGRKVAFGVGIVSNGPVESVRLFSKVPLGQIRTLALDEASLTSNHLAQILLIDQWGVHPELATMASDQQSMLATCDACVLIGDKGMTAEQRGLHVLDLGAAWTELTGLPFVWALWIGGKELGSELADWLGEAANLGADEWRQMVADASGKAGWTDGEVQRYLTDCIQFIMGTRELEGLSAYAERLLRHGLVPQIFSPEIVTGSHSAMKR